MKRNNVIILFVALAALLIITLIVSIMFGGAKLSIYEIFCALTSPHHSIAHTIILDIRLPRILLACAVGAGLAVSGCVFQGLLKNSLADSYTLGISGGAALGATCAIVSGISLISVLFVPVCSFAGAVLSLWIVYLITCRKGFSVYALTLTGVIFGFILSSLVLIILAVAAPLKIQSSLTWLMGNLSGADAVVIKITAIIVIIGILIITSFSNELDILTLGEEKALNLGVNTKLTRKILFITASLITGVCVSSAGIIGFVGLIVPHLMRKITGPKHKNLLIASALGGAIFLPLCDTIARTIISPIELPVGVITGLVGGVFFLIFLLKTDEFTLL
jgi:iron complex transport system permease protein